MRINGFLQIIVLLLSIRTIFLLHNYGVMFVGVCVSLEVHDSFSLVPGVTTVDTGSLSKRPLVA